MKIAFVYSEKYEKYEKLIESIINDLKINSQIICEINISKNTRKKYDLYIVFSDDKEDFDDNVSKLKEKPIVITSNLKSDYIAHVITKAIDVIYSKNKVSTIITRINENLKRRKCLEI